MMNRVWFPPTCKPMNRPETTLKITILRWFLSSWQCNRTFQMSRCLVSCEKYKLIRTNKVRTCENKSRLFLLPIVK